MSRVDDSIGYLDREAVLQVLRGWQSDKVPSSLFLNLKQVGYPADADQHEREWMLYDYISATVRNRLANYREFVETPMVRKPVQQFERDFSHHSHAPLRRLSTLYYTHIYDPQIPRKVLLQAAGVSKGDFRRQVRNGAEELARVMRYREYRSRR